MTIKKNVPYKVSKILWGVLIVLTIVNIAGCWAGWNGTPHSEVFEFQPGIWVFGLISGIFTLLCLIACAVAAFLSQKVEARRHGWIYSLLAVIHLLFVILIFSLPNNGNDALPAVFTVFLVAILAVCAYFAFAGKKVQFSSIFGKKNDESDLAPIRREDLGANPTEATVDQVANPENNPDRKAGRDEKTGIVSL